MYIKMKLLSMRRLFYSQNCRQIVISICRQMDVRENIKLRYRYI